MKKATVKKIFICVLVFLPLQYLAVGVIGAIKSDPWPALVLPGFKATTFQPNSNRTTVPIFTVETNSGAQLKLSTSKLFAGLKHAQRSYLMAAHFDTPSQLDHLSKQAKTWLIKRIKSQTSDTLQPYLLHIDWIDQSNLSANNIDQELSELTSSKHFKLHL